MNTKAWIKETASSKPINAKKIAKGIKVITAIIKLPENNLYKYVDKIFSKVWPATMLANNRTPKDTDRATYEINSIKTNKGTKAKGVPEGTKNEKKCNLWIDKPKIVTPINIVNDNPIETIIDVVIVNVYGILPTKLEHKINKNKE